MLPILKHDSTYSTIFWCRHSNLKPFSILEHFICTKLFRPTVKVLNIKQINKLFENKLNKGFIEKFIEDNRNDYENEEEGFDSQFMNGLNQEQIHFERQLNQDKRPTPAF